MLIICQVHRIGAAFISSEQSRELIGEKLSIYQFYNSYITFMIRRSINSKQNRNESKRQKSQQSKGLKLRKNGSSSPIYKQIIINKQNIHPNRNAQSPKPFVNQGQYREIYYNLKQKSLNSRLEKTRQREQLHFDNDQYDSNLDFKRGKQIKITNRSLEKCQIHPQSKSSPQAQYIIDQQEKGQIICCEQCGITYKNKIPLDRITNTYLGHGLTIGQYFKILNQRCQRLEKAQKNLQIYERELRNMSGRLAQKHRKHYNEILQIIQFSMKQSEDILARHVNEGEYTLIQKKEQVNAELKLAKEQIKKLLQFQQKQYKYNLSPLNNKVDLRIQHICKPYEFQIKLPVIQIYTQIPDLKEGFYKSFSQNYALQILTKEQLNEKYQQKSEKQTKRIQKQNSHQSSYQSFQRTTGRHEEQTDLFCDQQFGQNKTNKTHDFSFEKSREQELLLGKNNECIMELVEEEDVISPVFKAI